MKTIFPKTQQLIFDFEDERESRYFPYDDPHWEYNEDPWVVKKMTEIQKSFKTEYDSHNKDQIYFYGCLHSVYVKTYQSRLSDYLDEFEDNTKIGFIKSELNCEGFITRNYKYLDPETEKQIQTSLWGRAKFLINEANQKGYNLSLYIDKSQGLVCTIEGL